MAVFFVCRYHNFASFPAIFGENANVICGVRFCQILEIMMIRLAFLFCVCFYGRTILLAQPDLPFSRLQFLFSPNSFHKTVLQIDATKARDTISRHIYGHFAEHPGYNGVARIAGANVKALDINEQRLRFCKKCAETAHRVNGHAGDVMEQLRAITNNDIPMVVIDATGGLKAINNAFQYMAHGARYVLIGLQKGDIFFSRPEFHKREGTLMSSRNATQTGLRTSNRHGKVVKAVIKSKLGGNLRLRVPNAVKLSTGECLKQQQAKIQAPFTG